MCITYNGSLIDAVYHSTSNGYTEDSVKVWGNDIPYVLATIACDFNASKLNDAGISAATTPIKYSSKF